VIDLLSLSFVHRAEIVLVFAALSLLMLAPRLGRSPAATSIPGIAAAVATIAFGWQDDGIARCALVLAGLVMLVALLLLRTAELFDEQQRPESAVLILIGGIGAIVLATSASLLELALGVEMISLPSAALIALGRGRRPLEAGFKYFLLTAITFATLLFGMALVFVGTGSLAIPSSTSAVLGLDLVVAAGVGLVVVGLAFKLAIVPVHFGALDAYTAGPASFVGFVMMASKLGAAMALAKLAASMGAGVSSLLLGAGLVTIGFGVLASFAQTDLRRLLAYSAVVHAGFLAVAAGSAVGGAQAVRFYLVCYGAAALLGFTALAGTGTDGFPLSRLGLGAAVESTGGGIGRVRSIALLLALLSLAGVPPLPGFWAKLAVLRATWDSWGMLATALAALGGVIGIIYYLKPMPDLLACSLGASSAGTDNRGGAAVALALIVIAIALGAAPGLAWWLARA
jgi:NADH-quinone oxidoreductase subunit N